MDRLLLLVVDTMVDWLLVVMDTMMDWHLLMDTMMSRMMSRLDLDGCSYLVCSETDCVMGSVGSMMSCVMTMISMISMCSMMMMMVSPGSVRPGCGCGDEQRHYQAPHSVVWLSVV